MGVCVRFVYVLKSSVEMRICVPEVSLCVFASWCLCVRL